MAKGGNFEREICKQLSLWWTKNERDDIFWRTSNSGGRATSRRKIGKQTFGQYGDIQATDPMGQPLMDACSLELKIGYGSYSFLDMLDRPKETSIKEYEKFLKQATEDTKKAGAKWAMVISKRDYKIPIITFPKSLYVAIKDRYGDSFSYDSIKCGLCFFIKEYDECWYSLRFEDFLYWVEPKFFIKELWIKRKSRRRD